MNNTMLILAAVVILLSILVCWVLFRIAFPKSSSGMVRSFSLVTIFFFWSDPFRITFVQSYQFFRQLADSWGAEKIEAITLLKPLEQIPFFQILVAYIALALLVRVISSVTGEEPPRWFSRARDLPLTTRLDGLVLLVFFAGIYLSVASLCTIPSLQINQPFTEDERAQITAQIDAYNPTDEQFNKEFPEALSFDKDAVSSLRTLYQQATGQHLAPACISNTPMTSNTAATTTDAKPIDQTLNGKGEVNNATLSAAAKAIHDNPLLASSAQQVITEHDSYYCNQVSEYQSMRTNVKQIMRNQAENAKSQLNANFAVRLTGRDRADYTYTLRANVSETASALQMALNRCKQGALTESGTWAYAAAEIERNVEASTTEGAQIYSAMPIGYMRQETQSYCSLQDVSWRNQTIAPAPQMGIFSFFFGWLEDSDSLALAVLCGMLGVGLTGSIITTFVRQGQRAPGLPWIADAFPVVVRGFTAAIVVYLSIEGGLNIFSAATSQPNPYVLLLACLVGAVFSEDVWVAARKRLQSAESQDVQDEKKLHEKEHSIADQTVLGP